MYLCYSRICLFHRVIFTIHILIFLITVLSHRVNPNINVNPIIIRRNWFETPLRRRRISPPWFLLDLLILHRFLYRRISIVHRVKIPRRRRFIDRRIIFVLDDTSRWYLHVIRRRDFSTSRIGSIHLPWRYRFIILQIISIFDHCFYLRIFIIYAIRFIDHGYLFHPVFLVRNRVVRRIIFSGRIFLVRCIVLFIPDRLLWKILFDDRDAIVDRWFLKRIFLRAPFDLRSDRVEEGSVSAAMKTCTLLLSRWEIFPRGLRDCQSGIFYLDRW